MKLTKSKTASRRAHHRAGVPRLMATPTGHRRRHFVDPTTGMYRGKQIITIGDAQTVSNKESKKAVATQEKSANTATDDK